MSNMVVIYLLLRVECEASAVGWLMCACRELAGQRASVAYDCKQF